jgi:tetratricopeptide (TPR) repeat protein
MTRPLHFPSRILLAAALACLSAVPSSAHDQGDGRRWNPNKPLPKPQFIVEADQRFDRLYARAASTGHKDIATLIQANKKVFDQNTGTYLKHDNYKFWEAQYIQESLRNQMRGIQKQMEILDRAQREKWKADETRAALEKNKQDIQTNQFKIQATAQVQAKADEDGDGDLGAEHGGDRGRDRGDGAGQYGAAAHHDEWKTSDAVRLQDYSLGVALDETGGNRNHGGGPSGGGSAHGGNGAAPNSDGGTLADRSGELTDAGTAKLLADAGGAAMQRGEYSGAYRDAQTALMLQPDNKRATTILHFAKDRLDGGTTGGAPAAAAGSEAAASGTGADGNGETAGLSASGLTNSTQAGLAAGQLARDAQAALRLGDSKEALRQTDRALALDPNNPSLLNLRASIYARMHDYKRALADANAGLALSPQDRALLATKTYALLRSGDKRGAKESADALLALDPHSAFAYAARGQAEGLMGDRDAMLADLNSAAAMNPAYASIAAQAAKLQIPTDKDILFLFPGEAPAQGTASASPAPAGRGRRFGAILGVSALGGLLLALGLLGTVLGPVKEKASSVFTRLTRTGPSVGAAPGEIGAPSATGLVRGQYEITREIGVGGMGRVYEGTDRSLGRRVAIKKMRDELRADPRERARFVSEAKTVAALHHPNIVDIYAIAEEGEDVYLVFEFVDGKTVHDLIQGKSRLEPDAAARIVRASADALDFAHSRGVIHRDMKPSNVMVDSAGRVKVMDFGIARAAKEAMTRYSMTNTVVGTPPYMAPEQEQGQVRRESDVYALAVCAYEMLTGKLPFAGVGGGMALNKVNMSFIPPSKMTAGLPPALDAVFDRAFQADPDKRYRTPGEFAAALEGAVPAGARA